MSRKKVQPLNAMNSSDNPDPAGLIGRFVVVATGIRYTGITFDELTELLNRAESSDAAGEVSIHRIHRIYDDGKMELVGVGRSALVGTDCLLLAFDGVRDARAEFEHLKSAAFERPPPCRVHLAMKKTSDEKQSHAVGLVFPPVCGDAVRAWLNRARRNEERPLKGGPEALDEFEAAGAAIVEATLTTAPIE